MYAVGKREEQQLYEYKTTSVTHVENSAGSVIIRYIIFRRLYH
jgi:hypothetical protein